jgi:predicted dehydrogenase
MTQEKIRIGMMSFAHMHAASYAAHLQQMDDVELVGVWDADPARGKTMADRFETAFFTDNEALLAEGLDGVVICSENVYHRSLVELAAGQTKAILCEKPIATTPEDAQAMIDVCAATQTRLQIAFPVRFSPPVQRLKSIIAEGKLGRLFSAKCTNHGSMPGGWFIERELSGGGAVIDHTVHVIDLLRWMLGAEVTEVYAEVGDSLLHPGLGVDDAGLLSFRMSNGIYGTLDTSWSRPASYPTWGDVKLEILGEDGIAQVDAFAQHLRVSSDAVGKTRWLYWGGDMDRGLVQDFVAMIQEDRAPSITGEDGLRALEVALAAYQSAAQGAVVAIETESI